MNLDKHTKGALAAGLILALLLLGIRLFIDASPLPSRWADRL